MGLGEIWMAKLVRLWCVWVKDDLQSGSTVHGGE